ncbi:MAG: winged helix-turn-helix transcriptional regulator [Clostridia bacterium]|nr:winged helix-turn-helix transcriptional regulator [Clostridia bacterium]
MYKYYSPIDDAIIFFTTKVNKTMTVADLSRTLHKNHPSLEKKLERVIKPALELEKKLASSIKSIESDYDFLFRLDQNADGAADHLYNPAWLMFSFCSGRGEFSSDLSTAIKNLHSLPQHQRDVLFLSYLRDLKVFDDVSMIPRVSAEECGQLIETIRGLNMDSHVRTRLIELYVNFDEYVSRLGEILKPAVEIIENNEAIYGEALRKNEETVDTLGGLRGVLKQKYNFIMKNDIADRLHLCVLIPNNASMRDDINDNIDAFFGVNVLELGDLVFSGRENQKLSTMFKMLSDETRLEILHCICKKPMYGLELAEQFSISAPTISYHMRKLGMGGFTESYFDSGRTYYRANVDNIKRFIRSFEEFLSSEPDKQ